MKKIVMFFLLLLINIFVYSQSKEEQKTIKKIKRTKIERMEIILNDSNKTNEPLEFRVMLFTAKGKQIISKGSIIKHLFEVSSDGCNIDNNGKLVLKINQERDVVSQIPCELYLKKDNSIKSKIQIELNYKGKLIIDYSGKDGLSGKNVEKNLKEDGSQGIDGENGQNGEDGHILEAKVINYSRPNLSHKLFRIEISNKTIDTVNYFYINQLDSEIVFKVNGGNGGNGGNAGNGAKGEPTESEYYTVDIYGNIVPLMDHKPGGLGGNGGNGGSGGNCGAITLFMNESERINESLFTFEMEAGFGGRGGNPGYSGRNGDVFFEGKKYRDERVLEKKLISNQVENYRKNGKNGKNGTCKGTPSFVILNDDNQKK